jgi:hypothetical protein
VGLVLVSVAVPVSDSVSVLVEVSETDASEAALFGFSDEQPIRMQRIAANPNAEARTATTARE